MALMAPRLVQAQTTLTAQERSVWNSIETTWKHFISGDVDKAMADYEHWHRWGHSVAELWSAEDLRAYEMMGNTMGRVEDVHLEPVLIQVFDNAAIAHYTARGTYVTLETGERYPFASRWSDFRVRLDGRWVMVGGSRDGLCELVAEGEEVSERKKACRQRELNVTDGSWKHTSLSPDAMKAYIGSYEERLDEEAAPIPIDVWEDGGFLQITPLLNDTMEKLQLVPMGNHQFAMGRFEDGQLTTVYFPDSRIQFKEEGGKIVSYDFVSLEGDVSSTGTRIQ